MPTAIVAFTPSLTRMAVCMVRGLDAVDTALATCLMTGPVKSTLHICGIYSPERCAVPVAGELYLGGSDLERHRTVLGGCAVGVSMEVDLESRALLK